MNEVADLTSSSKLRDVKQTRLAYFPRIAYTSSKSKRMVHHAGIKQLLNPEES